ncbi:hypothetical protein ZIOFF_011828 [Zingiber officinale]|uniref:Uncharacterized protein n=1 Tax=Zingiber officinale TaxID=94328 RepID=A0A8J5HMX3_ZINOF|nr:hypothetical protein ZIOFF_011828 [Zingiber officinale]
MIRQSHLAVVSFIENHLFLFHFTVVATIISVRRFSDPKAILIRHHFLFSGWDGAMHAVFAMLPCGKRLQEPAQESRHGRLIDFGCEEITCKSSPDLFLSFPFVLWPAVKYLFYAEYHTHLTKRRNPGASVESHKADSNYLHVVTLVTLEDMGHTQGYAWLVFDMGCRGQLKLAFCMRNVTGNGGYWGVTMAYGLHAGHDGKALLVGGCSETRKK